GRPCPLVTGGGTGTAEADLALGVLNELQCGSYVFMDNQYVDALGDDTDGAPPRPASAPFAADGYFFFGDEHGGLMRPAGEALRLGQRVELRVPHCDPTVDRYDAYHLVRGDRMEA